MRTSPRRSPAKASNSRNKDSRERHFRRGAWGEKFKFRSARCRSRRVFPRKTLRADQQIAAVQTRNDEARDQRVSGGDGSPERKVHQGSGIGGALSVKVKLKIPLPRLKPEAIALPAVEEEKVRFNKSVRPCASVILIRRLRRPFVGRSTFHLQADSLKP